MIMWLIFAVLAGLFGWMGTRLGAVRMSIHLLCGMTGLWAGVKFGPMLTSIFAKYADGNPLILFVAPVLLVFLACYLAGSSLAYVIGEKVYMYYKYKTIDEKRVAWETMNKRVGLGVGVANGIWHFALIGLFAYTLGYWTIQLDGTSEGASNGSTAITADSLANYTSSSKPGEKPGGGGGADVLAKVANPLRRAMEGSGFEKFIAALDPLPDSFYHLADCVGIIYKNPTAARRFLSYPGTLGISEAPEIQAIVNDAAFQSMWAGQPSLKSLLTTPQSRAIFKNTDLLKQISAIDAKDAYEYVSEGKSAKYEGERILGRWDIHIPSTIVQAGKNNPNLAADLANLALLKRMMVVLVKDVSLIATPESKVMIKGAFEDEKPLAQMVNGRAPGVRTNAPVAKVLLTGTWKKEAGEGAYSVTFEGAEAKAETLQVLNNSSLNMSFFGGGLVFTKAD